MKNKNGGIIRKQVLIDQTSKAVFTWVVVASSLIGAAVVLMILLVQLLIFNEKVLHEKGKTADQLRKNITAAKELKAGIKVVDASPQLKVVRLNEDTPAIQSVLDALPADANDLALGASLQQKLLADVPGVSVESVSFAAGSGTPSGAVGGSSPSSEEMSQQFSFTVSGSPEALRTVLQRLERSIRAVDIQSISASSRESGVVTLQISGSVSYLPPAKLEMKQKVIKG